MVARVFNLQMGFSLLWLLAAGTGLAWVLNYQSASGRTGTAPEHWPAAAQIIPDSHRDTLIMFAHPLCPCTRASMEELNRLLARHRGQMAVQVMFIQPEAFTTNQVQSGLWRSAAAMPGVAVHTDLNGVQARLFGAETSGDVLLYDAQGRLLFRGGITGGRGHAGDNAGEDAIDALLAGQTTQTGQTPVYGCSLLGDATNTTVLGGNLK
jgi:hypothetical protein